MKKRKRNLQESEWPQLEMKSVGPSLASKDWLRQYPIALPDEHEAFLEHWNGGRPLANGFQFFAEDDCEQILILDHFFGAFWPKPDDYGRGRFDIALASLQFKDHLPRWSIPFGRVNEDSFLLTFIAGPHRDAVCYFIWLHDDFHEDNDPNDGDGLYCLDSSIRSFLSRLKPVDSFFGTQSYTLDATLKPRDLQCRLQSLGCEPHGRGKHTNQTWCWDKFDDICQEPCDIYIALNGTKRRPKSMAHIPWLAGVASSQLTLHCVSSNHIGSRCNEALNNCFGDALLKHQ